ncbi:MULTISPECIES: thiamine pyrophosphate-binding protein [Ramlibacter]|uniref:Thiamine pyrophosphate-binding protein n=1 Tax=Ramlibacter pinisoli TaxID=2682844 RepID=A0A6N8IWX5_9BURK|nr:MULTISPECIES: thiamine pyrophosphate-binding protein [Ramlibacter]MBA2965527.1 thiamine pyrophosphate-binding protein [Ramlibacter sp. CGMCC 1.13660]MVQ30493.1 thiamine pyrophosphate-binding protein [Ramlibacter pinisoli]
MTTMTGSRLIAEMLRDYGVSHVFYIPAMLLGVLAEMEDMPVRRIMTHGEKSAAYMADGYARASGRPGICMAQQIGGSNLAAGLRDAYMACAPVIALSGGPAPAAHYRNGYQEVEDLGQFDAVTKFNARVERVDRLPDLLRQAFRAATTGAPGPVHLEVQGPHGHVAYQSADMEPLAEPRFGRLPPFRPVADEADIGAALAQLLQAQRPLIVAGGGVASSDARAEVLRLAEALSLPVATTLNGKGTIPERHPLSVGVVGSYSRACANQAVCEADLVFFIGSRTGGQTTVDWQVPPRGTRVIQLDIDGVELGRNYPNVVSLQGDAKATLARLLALAADRPPTDRAAWNARTAGLVADWRAQFEPLRASDAAPLRPERICKEISDLLPPDGVVVSDTGHSGMWTGAMLELTQPDQRYIRCAGSMGWGFPGAMGVKCALPDRAVICFTGDGAFYYHLAELETAARFGINLVVVVNNNSALNQEIPLWDNVYPGKSAANARVDDLWRMRDTNFAEVARSLGCEGIRVTHPSELRGALEQALAMNRPVVVDVVSGVDAFAPRAWIPGGTGGY